MHRNIETKVEQLATDCSSCVIGHNGEKLLFVNFAILVEVELVDHGLPRTIRSA